MREADAHPDMDAVVRAMCEGDGEAFRTVYRSTQPTLVRYLEILVGPMEAEDVASETWAQACRDLHRFSGDADGFRGWVTTIGRHRALDHLRRRSRRPQVDRDLTGLEPAAADDVVESVAESLSTSEAMRQIRKLPKAQAEAVMLRAVMGLDARTAGQILGRRPGAVRTATQRGLAALGVLLEAEAPFHHRPCDVLPVPSAEEVR
ncbi:MAG: RNA polymerase sigma factor [Nocardioides sp.]